MPLTRSPLSGMLLLAGCAAASAAQARTLYVSATAGSNSNSGLSAASPVATIQYAAGLTVPGDTVLVMQGTYTNAAPGSNILWINRSGTAAAPITFRNYPGQTAVLRTTDNWAAIRITADYIVVDGLQIAGNDAAITSSYGLSQARVLSNPFTNGDGLDINQPSPGVVPHHITVQNMVIHDVPGGGIAGDYADYLTIQNNFIYNTANWSPYGDSAISIYEATDTDRNTGYKISVLRNTTFNNRELLPCVCRNYQSISDGNGIIIDDNLHTQSDNVRFGGRTLVAYNVSFGNGGSGISAYSSAHVDILNNTAYNDEALVPLDEGEIFADRGSDVLIADNILLAAAGKLATSSNHNAATVAEDYNVLWDIGGAFKPVAHGPDDILADPALVNPAAGNFALQPRSPALGTAAPPAATARLSPATAALTAVPKNRGAE